MDKIFKTKDNVFINIDDIVSIEENNGDTCVYLKNFSDYIILSHYEFQMLRAEIGLVKICTAQSGYVKSEVDGYKTVKWPDTNNNWITYPNVKWSLKQILSNDDSIFEILFENESLQSIIYNEKTKNLKCETFSGDVGVPRMIIKNLSQGTFSLYSNYNGKEESYLLQKENVFAVSANIFNVIINEEKTVTQIEYDQFNKNDETYIMFNKTEWSLTSYIGGTTKLIYDKLTNVTKIIIEFDGDNRKVFIYQNEIEKEHKLENGVIYKLSSLVPSGEINFDINGIITESTIDIETE